MIFKITALDQGYHERDNSKITMCTHTQKKESKKKKKKQKKNASKVLTVRIGKEVNFITTAWYV